MHITGLSLEHAGLAELLADATDEARVETLREIIVLGTRGMRSLALSATVDHADARFRRSVEAATERLETCVARAVAQVGRSVDESLDPDHRNSVMSRAIRELSEERDRLLDEFDLRRSDSRSARLVDAINQLVGPAGEMERLLDDALSANNESSALHKLTIQTESRLAELRELILRQAGAAEEAHRGTAKGFDFEQSVELVLRAVAQRIGGCTVEATGAVPGALTVAAKVGDFVLEDSAGRRLVIEAKNKASLSLTGKTGILAELDRAMENRRADFAICVSANDAFPSEVGGFGVYGSRLLVVDDGDGTLLEAGIRWALAHLSARAASGEGIDLRQIGERIQRIRQHASRISGIKRSLTALKDSVDGVHADITQLGTELRSEFDQLEIELGATDDRTRPLHLVGTENSA